MAPANTGVLWLDTSVGGIVGTQKLTFLIGDGTNTTYTVTHNLGTRDIEVTVYDQTTYAVIIPSSLIYSTVNTSTLTFSSPPALNNYKVVVLG